MASTLQGISQEEIPSYGFCSQGFSTLQISKTNKEQTIARIKCVTETMLPLLSVQFTYSYVDTFYILLSFSLFFIFLKSLSSPPHASQRASQQAPAAGRQQAGRIPGSPLSLISLLLSRICNKQFHI